MRHMRPTAASVVSLILIAMVSACSGNPSESEGAASSVPSSTTPSPTPTAAPVMTDEQARANYLKVQCPVVRLSDEGNANVDNYEAWKRIPDRWIKAADSGAVALQGDGSVAWPPAIAADVVEFTDFLLSDSSSLARITKTNSEEEFWTYQRKWADERDPIAGKRIRLKLKLDPDATKACDKAGL